MPAGEAQHGVFPEQAQYRIDAVVIEVCEGTANDAFHNQGVHVGLRAAVCFNLDRKVS
jgi:hypothetical protein